MVVCVGTVYARVFTFVLSVCGFDFCANFFVLYFHLREHLCAPGAVSMHCFV